MEDDLDDGFNPDEIEDMILELNAEEEAILFDEYNEYDEFEIEELVTDDELDEVE